ncbi:MAG: energy transducer TonB [Bacteroidota bacterium]
MKKERKPESFLQQPSYPGGQQAMLNFLRNNLRYPAEARKNKVDGTVRIRMDINHDGKVTAAKVLSSLGYGCDEEAQRVVKLLKFEVPKNRRVRAVFHKTINIHFNYKEAPQPPKAKPVVAPPGPTYTVTKGQTIKGQVKAPSKGKSYTYTIKVR